MGLGWQTFFAGVKKGADKIGLTPIIKNITDQAKQSFGGIVKNLSSSVTKNVFNKTQSATNNRVSDKTTTSYLNKNENT